MLVTVLKFVNGNLLTAGGPSRPRSLLGQKQYENTKPLLVLGDEGIMPRGVQIPLGGRTRLREALERLVILHTEWNKPNQAAEWKRKLTEFESK